MHIYISHGSLASSPTNHKPKHKSYAQAVTATSREPLLHHVLKWPTEDDPLN
jgi:hypothetical protein